MEGLPSAVNEYTGKKRNIALLGDELHFEIPINIYRVSKELTKKNNYNLLYIAGEAFNSPFGFHIQSNILYNLISRQTADGLITMSNLLCSFSSTREFFKLCLNFQPLPLVSLGVAIEGIPSVVLDNKAGMFDAVCHLIEVHQYSRIAFLKGPAEHPDVNARFSAYKQAMARYGKPVDTDLLLEGDFQQESGIQAVRELFDKRGKIPGRDVQAIVCCNDYMATGVLLELQKRGIRIPDDIALVGFDNISSTECLSPPLSTVHQPFDTMAEKAMEMLLAMLEGKEVPEVVLIDACFIPRRSCGCPGTPAVDSGSLIPEELDRLLQSAPARFLEHLNRQIVVSQIPRIEVWKQALCYLREPDKWGLPAMHDDFFLQSNRTAAVILGRTVFNTFSSASFENMVNEMGAALASTLDLAELMKILTEILPQAGITRCCLCLYEDPENITGELPPWSRLIMAFEQGRSFQLPEGGMRFATEQFLPEEIIYERGWNSWVAMALYFRREQMGYVLLDGNVQSESIFWTLRRQLNSALKGAMLLNETHNAYSLLMEANEHKTQFFINIAHETKTPLTLIQNYLSRYLEEHEPDESMLVIKQNIDLLLTHMLNFLDLEQLQKGHTVYRHNSSVNLSESARKKCMLFRGVAAQKNIRISLSTEKNVLIRIDPLALDRIFNNLLDNAVKYVQPGGRVKLEVWRDGDKALLCVSDNGPGLSSDTREHIFEPYYLLSQKKTSKQGIGVGLSIVKNIIDEVGADIDVSESKNGGACFTLAFAEDNIVTEGDELHEVPDLPLSPLVQGTIKEKNIVEEKESLLIVDDNIQLLKFMQASLEKIYNVFIARDLTEFRFKLKTIPPPALIISDVMLDGPDGFALLKEFSAMEEFNHIPFIFLTAMNSEKQRIKGIELGAIDYIEKPFSIEELKVKINSIITIRRRQEKHGIEQVRNKIESVLSGMEKSISGSVNPGFDILCRKFGIRGREPDIIRLLLGGLVHKEIADRLNISVRTVEYHITKIYKKCGVSNKFDLLNKFRR